MSVAMSELSSISPMTLRQAGAEFGRDLASALVLAAKRADGDRELKKHMSQIVLREISGSVNCLRDQSLPESLVAMYERACREACRSELLRKMEQEGYRAAA
jgi:hypothetical protein